MKKYIARISLFFAIGALFTGQLFSAQSELNLLQKQATKSQEAFEVEMAQKLPGDTPGGERFWDWLKKVKKRMGANKTEIIGQEGAEGQPDIEGKVQKTIKATPLLSGEQMIKISKWPK